MNQTVDSINDFIFMKDEVKHADIILIAGGSGKQLMERAADLYHKGYAKYILPSGSYNKKIPDFDTEWEFLHDVGLKLGVPDEAILEEEQATNTFENGEYSFKVIEKQGIKVKKAILVCKAFHSRRAYLSYKVNFPSYVKFFVSPVEDDQNIRRDNWYLDEDKIKRVMSEVKKIGTYFESYIQTFVEQGENQ